MTSKVKTIILGVLLFVIFAACIFLEPYVDNINIIGTVVLAVAFVVCAVALKMRRQKLSSGYIEPERDEEMEERIKKYNEKLEKQAREDALFEQEMRELDSEYGDDEYEDEYSISESEPDNDN